MQPDQVKPVLDLQQQQQQPQIQKAQQVNIDQQKVVPPPPPSPSQVSSSSSSGPSSSDVSRTNWTPPELPIRAHVNLNREQPTNHHQQSQQSPSSAQSSVQQQQQSPNDQIGVAAASWPTSAPPLPPPSSPSTPSAPSPLRSQDHFLQPVVPFRMPDNFHPIPQQEFFARQAQALQRERDREQQQQQLALAWNKFHPIPQHDFFADRIKAMQREQFLPNLSSGPIENGPILRPQSEGILVGQRFRLPDESSFELPKHTMPLPPDLIDELNRVRGSSQSGRREKAKPRTPRPTRRMVAPAPAAAVVVVNDPNVVTGPVGGVTRLSDGIFPPNHNEFERVKSRNEAATAATSPSSSVNSNSLFSHSNTAPNDFTASPIELSTTNFNPTSDGIAPNLDEMDRIETVSNFIGLGRKRRHAAAGTNIAEPNGARSIVIVAGPSASASASAFDSTDNEKLASESVSQGNKLRTPHQHRMPIYKNFGMPAQNIHPFRKKRSPANLTQLLSFVVA